MTPVDVLGAIARAAGAGTFAIIGAVARNAWAPPRATTDIDLAVSAAPSLLVALEQTLGSIGYRCVRRQQADPADSLPDVLVFRSQIAEPRQVDLLVAKTAFEAEVLKRAVMVEIGGTTLPVATPEDLVIYKLIADRPRDRDDIRAVARTQQRAGRPIDWDHVDRWVTYWGLADRLSALRQELGE